MSLLVSDWCSGHFPSHTHVIWTANAPISVWVLRWVVIRQKQSPLSGSFRNPNQMVPVFDRYPTVQHIDSWYDHAHEDTHSLHAAAHTSSVACVSVAFQQVWTAWMMQSAERQNSFWIALSPYLYGVRSAQNDLHCSSVWPGTAPWLANPLLITR